MNQQARGRPSGANGYDKISGPMDILASLNSKQRAAVTAKAAPTLVLAGPGSGKTRVLTQRIAYLVGQLAVRPPSILPVTSTHNTARQTKTREQHLQEGGLTTLTSDTC